MTGPVITDDLVQGVVRWLLDMPDVVAAVGAFPGTTVPWLFQQQLWVNIEGTQSTAAVIRNAGGWAGSNYYNSVRYPRLSLEIWADPLRDALNNISEPGEVIRRLTAAFAVFDSYLHRPQGGVQYWGSVRVFDSVRIGDYAIDTIGDGDGIHRLQMFYGVTQG